MRALARGAAAALLALAGCAVQVGSAPVPASAPPSAPAAAAPLEPLPAVERAEERMPPPEPLPLSAAVPAGELRMGRALQLRSTAYCLRGNMRTGVATREGMAAGDPAVLPLGSVVRVAHPDGRLVGYFVIMDTGGAVRGNRIDLWMASCAEARAWGVRAVVAEVVEMGRR